MPSVLIVDVETTGLDTLNSRVIEIGAILYNGRILKKYSTLVRYDLLEPIPAEIVDLTGITSEMLNKYGVDSKYAFKYLQTLIDEADYVLAHNGTNFDFPILDRYVSLNIGRIDSCIDFPYPASIKTRKLTHLMAEHHLAPSKPAHCAIADCESLLSLMLEYDIDKIIERSKEPNVTMTAIIHREDNALARAAGFRFTNKKWIRTCKESEVDEVRSSCDFPVV